MLAAPTALGEPEGICEKLLLIDFEVLMMCIPLTIHTPLLAHHLALQYTNAQYLVFVENPCLSLNNHFRYKKLHGVG